MKRRSQSRASVAKEPSPVPPVNSPTTSKRGRLEDGQQQDTTDAPSKRQRTGSQAPESTPEGDQTLVQDTEEGGADPATSPLTVQSDEEQETSAASQIKHSASPEEPTPTRHEKFWYEDGSVVVQVEGVLFRLYKSLLSVQSSYFRDLFADQDAHPTKYDVGSGVFLPLYVLPDDELEVMSIFDFERLLEVLENPHHRCAHTSPLHYGVPY